MSEQRVFFEAGGKITFDGWFNVFALESWAQAAGLDELHLRLVGSGTFEVSVYHQQAAHSKECVYCERHCISEAAPLNIELSGLLGRRGFLAVQLVSLEPAANVSSVDWIADAYSATSPHVVAVIPTFHREREAEDRVSRLSELKQSLPSSNSFDILVVDNGGTIRCSAMGEAIVVPSENFGGAGGFARGLIKARDLGASHCLFMDDDVDFSTESIRRVLVMLELSVDPDTAVAGAMISNQDRTKFWEIGAQFDGFCRPAFHRHSAVDQKQVENLLSSMNQSPQQGFYAGWWMFAFPLQNLAHLPFPFFLRGDDISFGLANRFRPFFLPGVAVFQDGFTYKESPKTWYLDLRAHLCHLLTFPDLHRSTLATLKVPLAFLAQCLFRFHYQSARAVLMGLEDVLNGPEYFAQNANLTGRLKQLDANCEGENWGDTPIRRRSPMTRNRKPKSSLWYLLGNGHFVPFYASFGRHVEIRAEERRNLALYFGASKITVVNGRTGQSYFVEQNKLTCCKLVLRFCWLALFFLLNFKGLRRRYSKNYASLTSESFWRSQFRTSTVRQKPREEVAAWD